MNGIGPIMSGLLDQIFDLAPQRRVRLEPDHIHKKERQKYYNFAFGCILLALLVAKLFVVLFVFYAFLLNLKFVFVIFQLIWHLANFLKRISK